VRNAPQPLVRSASQTCAASHRTTTPCHGRLQRQIRACKYPKRLLPSNWFLDVNRGSQEQWRELPGCTDDMADLLVRLQRGGVQFAAADDLFRLLDLPTDLAQLWAPHLISTGMAMRRSNRWTAASISTTPVPQNSQPWLGQNNASMGCCASDASRVP